VREGRDRLFGAGAWPLLLPAVGVFLALMAPPAVRTGASGGQEGGEESRGRPTVVAEAGTRARERAGAPASRPGREDFVGAEACAACHGEVFEAWRGSTHGRAGGPPTPDRVLAPFDGTPIRFADAVVVPSRTPDGGFIFTVNRPRRQQIVFEVEGVVGGGHMLGGGTQGFMSRFPDGTLRFLPFDWSRNEGTWFCNTAPLAGWWDPGGGHPDLRADSGWTPITPEMELTDCGDWPPIRILGSDWRFANCQGCHGSQISARFDRDEGRYTTAYTSLAINCESCHGPGREHVEAARAGTLEPGGPGAMADLAGLSEDGSLETCFRCHAVKRQLEPGYLAGEGDFESHYSVGVHLVGEASFFPDGRIRSFAYQLNHRYSDCYLSGRMTCVSCHEPHGQGYWDVFERPLENPYDDGQCLGCHAAKAEDPESHTRHPPASDGARCVSCHMPYRQQPNVGETIPYARSDHTISIPRPGVDEALGLRSACSLCHGEMSPAEARKHTDDWYGETKPLRPVVAGLMAVETAEDGRPSRAEAARLLLHPETDHPLAQIAALNRFVEGFLVPGSGPLEAELRVPLEQISGSPDSDLRGFALAVLHLMSGEGRPPVDPGSVAPEVLARWAASLEFLGEGFRRRGEIAATVEAYRRADQLSPRDADLLLGLASALHQAGEIDGALETYGRALEVDSLKTVALVNRGVILEAEGRILEAEAAYRRAVELNPGEALAWANLGAIRLRRREARDALEALNRAVRYDPGLTSAQYNRAIAALMVQDAGQAVPALLGALEFEPEFTEARQLLRRIEEAYRRPP